MIIVEGSIEQLKSRVDASGDRVQTVLLEVHGDFAAIHALMQRPLKITLEPVQ